MPGTTDKGTAIPMAPSVCSCCHICQKSETRGDRNTLLALLTTGHCMVWGLHCVTHVVSPLFSLFVEVEFGFVASVFAAPGSLLVICRIILNTFSPSFCPLVILCCLLYTWTSLLTQVLYYGIFLVHHPHGWFRTDGSFAFGVSRITYPQFFAILGVRYFLYIVVPFLSS